MAMLLTSHTVYKNTRGIHPPRPHPTHVASIPLQQWVPQIFTHMANMAHGNLFYIFFHEK